MSDKYILDGKQAIMCHDLIEWAKWYETADRVIKQDIINGYLISTVFLGLDHNFSNIFPKELNIYPPFCIEDKPLLFETMVFKDKSNMDLDCERYTTWEEAEEGHEKMVDKYRYKIG